MFHCPVGVWVIEQRAIILSATVRSPTVIHINDDPISTTFTKWRWHADNIDATKELRIYFS